MSGPNRSGGHLACVLLALTAPLLAAAGPPAAEPVTPPAATRAQEAGRRFRLGQAALEHGDWEGALPHLEAAAALTPTWGLAQLAYARCRRALDLDPDRTLSALEAATESAPANPAVWQRMAELLPEDAQAHTRIGVLALEAGDLPAARSHLRVAAGLDPDAVVARTRLVEALERAGLVAEATRELMAYARANPDNSYVWRRLAALLGRHGDEAGARRARQAAERIEARRAVRRRRMRPLQPTIRR